MRPSQHGQELFGANHNAYSTKWTGSSQARPEWNDAETDKASRWAIASTDTPASANSILFVLPWHINKGAVYTKWLCHPAMQEIKTISRRYIKLEHPLHWSTGVQLCHEETKRDVTFLVVANEAGLRTYAQQSALASGFANAAQCLADRTSRIKALRPPRNNTLSAQATHSKMFPPSKLNKADRIEQHRWRHAHTTGVLELPEVMSTYRA